MIELVVGMALLIMTLASILMINQSRFAHHEREYQRRQLYELMEKKRAELYALGYWMEDTDTRAPTFPDNPYDMAVRWHNELAPHQAWGTLACTPIQEDGYTGMRVTVSVHTASDQVSGSMQFLTAPIPSYLQGLVHHLAHALKRYAHEYGHYPESLRALVPHMIPHIPNDPFTNAAPMISHTEETMDWDYRITDGMLSLSARTHPHLGMSWSID